MNLEGKNNRFAEVVSVVCIVALIAMAGIPATIHQEALPKLPKSTNSDSKIENSFTMHNSAAEQSSASDSTRSNSTTAFDSETAALPVPTVTKSHGTLIAPIGSASEFNPDPSKPWISRLQQISFKLPKGLVKPNESFEVNLFSDEKKQEVVALDVSSPDKNSEILSGLMVEGDAVVGKFTISTVTLDGEVGVNARFASLDGTVRMLEHNEKGDTIVTELNQTAFPGCGNDSEAEVEQHAIVTNSVSADKEGVKAKKLNKKKGKKSNSNNSTEGSNEIVASADGAVVKVLVPYTPSAMNAAGGLAAMLALINLAVIETNTAYANSQVTSRIALAGTVLLEDATGLNMSQKLSALANTNDSYFNSVHALRQSLGADLVAMIAENTEYCGIGYLMQNLAISFASFGFSVVSKVCATGYYSFGHEIGHNMGLNHDRANAGTPSTVEPFSYAFGWHFTGINNVPYRSIMAYAPGLRVPYFSNPAVSYMGAVTGTVTDNNAGALNITMPVAAQFRSDPAENNPATYSLSGTITDSIGSPLSGVSVGVGSAASATTTASNGTYSFSGLVAGNYTVTPTLPGYIFTPASISVTISSSNSSGNNFTSQIDDSYNAAPQVTGLNDITISGLSAQFAVEVQDIDSDSVEINFTVIKPSKKLFQIDRRLGLEQNAPVQVGGVNYQCFTNARREYYCLDARGILYRYNASRAKLIKLIALRADGLNAYRDPALLSNAPNPRTTISINPGTLSLDTTLGSDSGDVTATTTNTASGTYLVKALISDGDGNEESTSFIATATQ